MAERFNGKAPYTRRTHGSDRRGVISAPEVSYAHKLSQSLRDLELVRTITRERVATSKGIGNHELPAFKHKAELVANIDTHKAVIIGGETGSGKSTQLPQFLYEAGFDMTIVLVPRRIIADGLCDRIREEMSGQIADFNAEETIGIIHGERTERHDNNKILVMTPNTFIKMEKELKQLYDGKKLAIIADEVHEANLFIEIGLGAAAISVKDQDDWHIIAASATHNADTLQKPFQKLNEGYVPSVEIKGRPFLVDLQEEPSLNPMQAYARDSEAHEKAMIFTSGKKEIKFIIEETKRALESHKKGSSEKVIFRELHGELTEVELSHINDPIPAGNRLVIVSSPAGMSGITIPGVTYVAMDGTINRSELDDDNAKGLIRRMLSKAGVMQQAGRAGRDVPGGIAVLCAPVQISRNIKAKTMQNAGAKYQDDDMQNSEIQFLSYADREEHEPPEIYNTDLSRIVLSVAALGYKFSEINEYIPHPVQQLNIFEAEAVLTRLGALDDDGSITEIGIEMDKYPVSVELSRGLVEATGLNRSLQHKVRAAFIAASVDVGGLQDQDADADARRMMQHLIRSQSMDDLMVQLDLMIKLHESTGLIGEESAFVEQYGLHPKRVERVKKSARKILHSMGIRPQNNNVIDPTPDEEQLLRNDFTAGYMEYIFEDIGNAPRSKKTLYRSIHGNSESTTRTISDRSRAIVPRGQLVAGIPRYYTKGKLKDGTEIKHDILDHVFIVDPLVVGHYALRNNLIQGVWKESRMVNDKVVDYEQGMFGSILVGSPVERNPQDILSEESQDVLVNYVLNRQGRKQKALRALSKQLEHYRDSIPPHILKQLREPDAPEDITQDAITEVIKHAVKHTVSAHGVEEQISSFLYNANLTLSRYYSSYNVQILEAISPEFMMIGNEEIYIRYEAGQPYVTNLPKRQLDKIQAPVYLPDGREILYQRDHRQHGTERVSFKDARN